VQSYAYFGAFIKGNPRGILSFMLRLELGGIKFGYWLVLSCDAYLLGVSKTA
jgi:hypothetical protein